MTRYYKMLNKIVKEDIMYTKQNQVKPKLIKRYGAVWGQNIEEKVTDFWMALAQFLIFVTLSFA